MATYICDCGGRLFYKKITTERATRPLSMENKIKGFSLIGGHEETLHCQRCGKVYLVKEEKDGTISKGPIVVEKPETVKEFKDWPGRRFKVAELYNKLALLKYRAELLTAGMGRFTDEYTHEVLKKERDRLQEDFDRLMETDMVLLKGFGEAKNETHADRKKTE